MEASDFDELAFFRAIAQSGVRALLIGRRALVLLGLLWSDRRSLPLAPDVAITLPNIAGLIRTKQISARPKDLEDIRLLEVLRQEDGA